MTDRNATFDEQLIEVLDRALDGFRGGVAPDIPQVQSCNSVLDEEGKSLLKTLQDLALAADTWRGSTPDSLEMGLTTIPGDRPAPDFVGRYQIRRLIGSGAMGDVYEAYDPQLDRQVAVKVPRCERLAKNRTHFTHRFLREARAAAAVRHPHICPIYDAGETDGQPFVVMALVAGESLESKLSHGRIENVSQVVALGIQIADALQVIHEHGIIHRDLKPGNILLDEAGQAIITDFGLAVSTLESTRLTGDGLIIGTPVYMSPEQAAGDNSSLTAATDLYSFGAVFYEMLTGSVPFRGPLLQLLQRIQVESPVSPLELRPDLDEALAFMCLKLMSKKPQDRYSSASELAQELRNWHDQHRLANTSKQLAKSSIVTSVTESSQSSNPGDTDTQIVAMPASSIPPVSTENRSDVVRGSIESTSQVGNRWRLKTVRLAGVIAGLTLILAGSIGFLWMEQPDLRETPSSPVLASPHSETQIAQTAPSVSPPRLSGDFSIVISSDPEKGAVTKNRIQLEERGAYPLRNGELVQFEARLNQPGYIYLLWVNPDGTVTPLYPWDVEHEVGFQAPFVSGSERATDHVICPSSQKEGLEAGPPVGLQTFVMLARRSPLPKDIDLARLLDKLPHGPKLDTQLVTVRPQLRGIVAGRTKSVEYALFDELDSRLSPHFEFVRMMTFPQVSE